MSQPNVLAQPEAGLFKLENGKTSRGFTLVELLVVIAIIAVLMAILMPALQRVRMQAKNVQCKANLKTYGLVMQLYTGDYEDRLPESFISLYSLETIQEARRLGGGGWNATLPKEFNLRPDGVYIPYLRGDVKSSICPVFADVYHQEHPDRPKPDFTYSFNWWLNADKPIIPKVTMVLHPSRTFFAGEEGVWPMNDENGKINGATFNDNSLCTRWEGGMSLQRLKELNASDFPPSLSKKWPYTDAFGEYHRVGMRKINTARINNKLCGGVSNAVCVDGAVTEVTPYDTFKYAIGIK